MVRLGDVAAFQSGGTPSRGRPDLYDGDTPWITGADIGPTGKITPRSFITETAIRSCATNRVPLGTVLLVTRTSVGKVAVADRDLCFSQDITAIQPDRSRLDERYLVHLVRARGHHFTSQARGATIQGVTRQVVESLPVPLPPVEEQRRIAAILDHADSLRAKRKESLAAFKGIERSIFLSMFGDPMQNPFGLPMTVLGALGTLDRGVSRHRPRNDPRLLGGAHPLIQTGDVSNSNGYVTQYSSTYSDLGLAQSKLWPAGTLCITIAANIARTGLLTFGACFPDSVVGFCADSPTAQYVRVWMGFLQGALEAAAPQSAQKNINLALLRNLPVARPHRDLMAAFEGRLGAMEQVGDRVRHSVDGLDGLFQSLQARAFSGRL